MNVTEKIAEAVHAVECGCEDGASYVSADIAEAVVAAIRAMTPAEQAELIGGQRLGRRRAHDEVERVVGPWREVTP